MESMTTDEAVPADPPRRSHWLLAGRAARKVLISTLGALVVLGGILLLPLPGPGMVVVGIGLALLSTEYRWPGRLSRWLQREAAAHAVRLRNRRRAARR